MKGLREREEETAPDRWVACKNLLARNWTRDGGRDRSVKEAVKDRDGVVVGRLQTIGLGLTKQNSPWESEFTRYVLDACRSEVVRRLFMAARGAQACLARQPKHVQAKTPELRWNLS